MISIPRIPVLTNFLSGILTDTKPPAENPVRFLYGCCGCGQEITKDEPYVAVSTTMKGWKNLRKRCKEDDADVCWEGWVMHDKLDCRIRGLFRNMMRESEGNKGRPPEPLEILASLSAIIAEEEKTWGTR